MRAIPGWRKIWWRLWSVRFAVAAGILSALEVVLPLYQDAFPRGTFAAISVVLTIAAVYARGIPQPSITGTKQ